MTKPSAQTIENASKIFEAWEDCVFRNFASDDERAQVKRYTLHKLIWSQTMSNEMADEITSDIFGGLDEPSDSSAK